MTTISPRSALHRALLREAREHPFVRKLLVCPTYGVGREILRAVAASGEAWIGFETTTPRPLAIERAGPEILAHGLTLIDDFDQQALVDEALDRALEPADAELRELGGGIGFRAAVLSAVRELRIAGVTSERLREAGIEDRRKRELLTAVLAAYEGSLADRKLVDTADLLRRAADSLGKRVGADGNRVLLLPGLTRRGLVGRWLEALIEQGAVTLPADPVTGLEPPARMIWSASASASRLSCLYSLENAEPLVEDATLDFFAAASPADELREALRRAAARGRRWDEIEIVASDPVVYGSALHVLAARLEIPVGYAVGLPVERTRPGRAVVAWLQWVESGFPAAIIRRLIEGGDLRAPPGSPPAGALARRLRRLSVGWGRDRYLQRIDAARAALERGATGASEPDEDEAAVEERRQRSLRELDALDSILRPLLRASPPAPTPTDATLVSPAELARGLSVLLERVPHGDGPDAIAHERMSHVLARIVDALVRPAPFPAAAATLRRYLQMHVPARSQQGSAPWSSTGGHLHLTDLEHGGLSGRPEVFVLGLSADRVPGSGQQQPLLLDADRRAVSADALPTSAERLHESRFRIAALLARLRGNVTLSYSAWSPVEARSVAPAAIMLQAFRLERGDTTASFEDLHRFVTPVACAVPHGGARIDASDVWLGTLSRGGVLLDGVEAVRASFPRLDRGLRARNALQGDVATPYHGRLRPRTALDPRRDLVHVLSASRLEALGTCQLRYLYSDVLGIRPPDDIRREPDRWLDALERGTLLHVVYERSLRLARERDIRFDDAAFAEITLALVETVGAEMRAELPAPSDGVYRAELDSLRQDAACFVEMVRTEGADWLDLEMEFGLHGEPPLVIPLGGGDVRLRGKVDRVDGDGDRLVVIDYKTGSAGRFEDGSVFAGGRRLQPTLYAHAAAARLGRPVERFEYHFPTRKAENTKVAFQAPRLHTGLALVDRLLDAVAEGRFLPTDDSSDCRFCDFTAICRMRPGRGVRMEGDLTDWAARHFPSLDDYSVLRQIRDWEHGQ